MNKPSKPFIRVIIEATAPETQKDKHMGQDSNSPKKGCFTSIWFDQSSQV
jgi:hypothetical protein